MNTFALLFALALVAAACAHGHGGEHGTSYHSRHDEHGHHTEIKVQAHGGGDGGHSGGSAGHSGGQGHGHSGGSDHGHSGGSDEHGGHHHIDYIHHPAYKYEYGVEDKKTKDHHNQWEHRDGDKVHGEYTLHDADGTIRVVKYTSDKKSGFSAHVERIGHAVHEEGKKGGHSGGDEGQGHSGGDEGHGHYGHH